MWSFGQHDDHFPDRFDKAAIWGRKNKMEKDNKAFWQRFAKLYGPVMEESGAHSIGTSAGRFGPI